MKNKQIYIIILILITQLSFAQETIAEILGVYNEETIPYITVEELHSENDFIILDAREIREYNVSHLNNAIYAGYDQFDINVIIQKVDKDSQIVVYCTLGVRSEDIGEQLEAAGYSKVYNLFGGIMQWKNENKKVYDATNRITENVHVCDSSWSKWLKKGVKIYD